MSLQQFFLILCITLPFLIFLYLRNSRTNADGDEVFLRVWGSTHPCPSMARAKKSALCSCWSSWGAEQHYGIYTKLRTATALGEGSVFFVVSKEESVNIYAKVESLACLRAAATEPIQSAFNCASAMILKIYKQGGEMIQNLRFYLFYFCLCVIDTCTCLLCR